jgi:hypothetical protein
MNPSKIHHALEELRMFISSGQGKVAYSQAHFVKWLPWEMDIGT